MTRKRFLELRRPEACKILAARILHNCENTISLIEFCALNDIEHYRLSSSLFPLVGERECGVTLANLGIEKEVVKTLRVAGELAKIYGITLSSHPSQYITLFSGSPNTVANSITDLEMHGFLHDSIGLAADHSNPINIHPTGGVVGAEEIFGTNFARCSQSVRKRLVLENCDKGERSCKQLFEFSRRFFENRQIRIPLTYDNLHDQCLPSLDDNDYADLFKITWGGRPIFHWSEGGKNGKIRSHVDYFSHLPDVVRRNTDVTWECEVKAKDAAIKKAKKEFDL